MAAILQIDDEHAGSRSAQPAQGSIAAFRTPAAIVSFRMDRPEDKPRPRDVLRDWARAPGYSHRAAEFLELARCAELPAVRKRYLKIAEHYRALAEVEKRVQIKKHQATKDPTRVK